MRNKLLAAATLLAFAGCHEAETPLAAFGAEQARGREFTNAIPILRVANLKASQRYWRDVLGFKVAWEDGDPPDFGAVTRGDATFFMCQQCQSNAGMWSMVFVKNVDKLHEELAAKHAKILQPPKDMPWKLREMHVADPDGNVVRFASNTKHP